MALHDGVILRAAALVLANRLQAPDFDKARPTNELLRDPQLQESLIIVGKSPLGWVAIDKTIQVLESNNLKSTAEKVYTAVMKGTSVSEDDQKRYMRDRGWIARFAEVASVFTQQPTATRAN